MSLFLDLLHDPAHEGWNEYDLPTLKLSEIQFLCRCLGAPKSGTKMNVVVRLLAVRHVRTNLSKYAEADLDGVVADFDKVALKWMAKEAGLWRSGNKRQLAAVLLMWRNRARVEGQKYLDEQFRLMDAALPKARQLRLPL
jgi:hypothetical protein